MPDPLPGLLFPRSVGLDLATSQEVLSAIEIPSCPWEFGRTSSGTWNLEAGRDRETRSILTEYVLHGQSIRAVQLSGVFDTITVKKCNNKKENGSQTP